MCRHCLESFDEEDEKAFRANSRKRSIQSADNASQKRNFSGPFSKTPGRLLAMGFIRFYQLTLSSLIGSSCRHLPTCSEYGYEAVARHGLWFGGWMTLFRVARCGPGGTSGFDPVVEALEERHRWWLPWRLFRLRQKADEA